MTFLNPLALIGLLAALIPLIFHLLNLRKLKTIEFSTLTFLKELQETKIRRLKLRQILLLIIRTLMIIFIVLAFSRPALKGTMLGTLAQHAVSTIVIIFDDSFSMGIQDQNGEYFKQAQKSAISIIELANPGDEIYLIKLSDIEATQTIPARDREIVTQIVSEMKISQTFQPIENALRYAAKILNNSQNANKELYLISDIQKTHFLTEFKKENLIFPDQVKVFVIEVGDGEIQNTAIDSIIIETKIFELNKPVIVKTSVQNFGKSQLRNFVASIYLDGIRSAQKSLDINSWSSTVAQFNVLPKIYGFVKGYIELESDNLEYDNRRYFSFYVPEKLSVVLVSSGEENSKFLKLALTSNSHFELKQLPPERLSSVNMNDVDVIIMLSYENLSSSEITKLKNFVFDGGGLIIFPESDTNIEAFNRFLMEFNLSISDGIFKAGIGSGFTFHKIDFDHPLFSGVFLDVTKQNQKEINSPQIFISTKRKTESGENQIISTSNGYPFLSEQKIGNGRLLIYSVALKTTWSDLPYKSLFAPLIFRSVSYSAAGSIQNENKIVGEEVFIKFNKKRITQPNLKLVLPDGTDQIIDLSRENYDEKMRTLKLGKLETSGIYELTDGKNTLMIIAANLNPLESDLRKITVDEIYSYMGKFGVGEKNVMILKVDSEIKQRILQSRFGTELWKFAIVIVLILVFLEMLIASDRKKDIA